MNCVLNNKKFFVLFSIFLLLVLTPLFLGFHVPLAKGVFGPEDIFFETGMESGVLQPPWDHVGEDGVVEISSTHAKTGTYSAYMYQDPPTKTDDERRCRLFEYGSSHGQTEGYISFWIYVDSQFAVVNPDWGPTLGGFQLWFGPGGYPTYYWWTGMRFGTAGADGANPGLQVSYTWGKIGGGVDFSASAEATEQTWDIRLSNESYRYSNMEDTWTQLQIYWKIATGSNGICRAYVNGTLVAEKTSISTDPQGYSAWNNPPIGSGPCVFRSTCPNACPNIGPELYQGTGSKENWCWYDDIVAATEKVTLEYTVGGVSEFERFENGFEDGDDAFPLWSGTEESGGTATVTSSIQHAGTYSANFTSDGNQASYVRIYRSFQDRTSVYMRTYFRLDELPDTNDTSIHFMKFTQSDGTTIVRAGVYRLDGTYYWTISVQGESANTTADTINADTWYSAELYMNSTVNGNATLWINNVKKVWDTGDFSAKGDMGRTYIYLDCWTSQASSKTIFHDDVVVDEEYIGSGTTRIFQGNAYYVAGGESSPLAGVKINGSETDSNGYFEWSNLEFDTPYIFDVEPAGGYYPAWCYNVNGEFNWNGTHYILNHTIVEEETDYIELYFFIESKEYISSSNGMIQYASIINNLLSFTVSNLSASSVTEVYGGQPTWVTNLEYSVASDYSSVTNLFTVNKTHSADDESFELSWQTLPWTMYFNQVANGYLVTGSTSSSLLRLSGTCVSTDSYTTLYIYSTKRPRYVKISGSYVSFSYNSGTKILSFNVTSSPPKKLDVLFGFSDEEITGFSILGTLQSILFVLSKQLKKIKCKIEEKIGKQATAIMLSFAFLGVLLFFIHLSWTLIEIYLLW